MFDQHHQALPRDASQAVILTLEKNEAVGQTYNIGTSDPFNFGTIIPYLAAGMGMPFVSLNLPLSPYHGRTSNAKIRAQLGYRIKYDPFRFADEAIAAYHEKQPKGIEVLPGL